MDHEFLFPLPYNIKKLELLINDPPRKRPVDTPFGKVLVRSNDSNYLKQFSKRYNSFLDEHCFRHHTRHPKGTPKKSREAREVREVPEVPKEKEQKDPEVPEVSNEKEPEVPEVQKVPEVLEIPKVQDFPEVSNEKVPENPTEDVSKDSEIQNLQTTLSDNPPKEQGHQNQGKFFRNIKLYRRVFDTTREEENPNQDEEASKPKKLVFLDETPETVREKSFPVLNPSRLPETLQKPRLTLTKSDRPSAPFQTFVFRMVKPKPTPGRETPAVKPKSPPVQEPIIPVQESESPVVKPVSPSEPEQKEEPIVEKPETSPPKDQMDEPTEEESSSSEPPALQEEIPSPPSPPREEMSQEIPEHPPVSPPPQEEMSQEIPERPSPSSPRQPLACRETLSGSDSSEVVILKVSRPPVHPIIVSSEILSRLNLSIFPKPSETNLGKRDLSQPSEPVNKKRKCPHGFTRGYCPKCNNCGHDSTRRKCSKCRWCDHGTRTYLCDECK